jgi:hypothetical protein
MGSNMEIFEARVLGENLSFWFEKSPVSKLVIFQQKIKILPQNPSNISM